MLAFRRLFVDFELSSLWQRAFVFKDVQLDAPLARAVIRPDGSVNLADLALPDEEDKDEPLPAVWIQRFALGDGTVQFADLARRVPLERQFTPVNFKLENFKTTPEGGAFGLTAKTQNAELMEWRGTFALAPAGVVRGRTRDHQPERARRARGGRRRTALRHSAGRDEPARFVQRCTRRGHAARRAPAADADQRPDAARAGPGAGLRRGADGRHQRHEDRDAGQYGVAGHDRRRRRQGRRLDDAGRHAEHRPAVRRTARCRFLGACGSRTAATAPAEPGKPARDSSRTGSTLDSDGRERRAARCRGELRGPCRQAGGAFRTVAPRRDGDRCKPRPVAAAAGEVRCDDQWRREAVRDWPRGAGALRGGRRHRPRRLPHRVAAALRQRHDRPDDPARHGGGERQVHARAGRHRQAGTPVRGQRGHRELQVDRQRARAGLRQFRADRALEAAATRWRPTRSASTACASSSRSPG